MLRPGDAVRHQQLTPEHLSKALLDDKKGLAAGPIRAAGGDLAAALAWKRRSPNCRLSRARARVRFTPPASLFVEQTEQLAENAGDNFVTAERADCAACHKTPGLPTRLPRPVEPAKPKYVHQRVAPGTIATPPEDQYEALKKYTRDLTQAASDSKIDPVIGDEEIRRTMQVLAAHQEQSGGEPGVGKTAIVEGLACASSTATCPRV